METAKEEARLETPTATEYADHATDMTRRAMMIVRIVGMEVLGLELVHTEEGNDVLKPGARNSGGESVGPLGVTTGCASGLGGVTSTGTVASEEEAAAKLKPAALRASAPNMAAARFAPAETGVRSMATLPKPTR
eukprot:1551787-Rhodomonas_salina.1